MISLVIVSHNRLIAEGVVELASQMAQGRVPMAAAGGMDDPENPIGTSAIKIQQAIEAVYSEDGVLVLMDLGSAVLNAELAIEFLEPEQQAHVSLCLAPLVEGAVVAAAQAAAGSPLTAVKQEALMALAAKQQQAGMEVEMPAAQASPAASGETVHSQLLVHNRLGLHARPAARFVNTAVQFQADIQVKNGTRQANGKSMNQMVTLGVRHGDQIELTAVGPDAKAAIAAIEALAADNFGDDDSLLEALPPTAVADRPDPLASQPQNGVGVAASAGIAMGPAFYYRPTLPPIEAYAVEDVATEIARFETAVAAADQEIDSLYKSARHQVGLAHADIFQAHRLILQDPELQTAVRQQIERDQTNAEVAWQQAIESTATRYEQIDDPYLQARASDVRDVGQRLLRQLLGVTRPSLALPEPVILLADELTPSDTAQLDPAHILGIVTARGGATSHSAILARGLGIPAVLGVGGELLHQAEGLQVAIDGSTGQVWLNPEPTAVAEIEQKRADWLAQQQQARAEGQAPAVTQDGRVVEVVANIGGAKEAITALQFGAEGVGLFRSEFLFMDREAAPSEEEQYQAYVAAAQVMGQRPLIIRTLDVGGDKPLPYLHLEAEDNPFLGWRGIRFCLETPHLFKPQLRAILRASAGHQLKIMFPMVGTLAEVQAAKGLLTEVQAELRQAQIPFDEEMEVGIMIEVPAAVLIADQLAQHVDFFSIGTNDLAQYTMAADRGNAKVASLANALHPAVLRLIKQTADAAHAAGIWVGMCGELAGDVRATPLLLGLALDELSMAAPAIPAVKAAIRRLSQAQAEEAVVTALALPSATAVADYLAQLAL